MTDQQSSLTPRRQGQPPRPTQAHGDDPFQRKRTHRNHFPGLDMVFGSTVDVETTPKRRLNGSFSRNNSPFRTDRSMCSSCNASNVSTDMSIGARASMNEHLRHIARYGFDGQPVEDSTIKHHQAIDEEWDHLLDGNSSVVSWTTDVDSSFAAKNFVHPISEVNEEGDECVEVVADMSDFFNSSRVHQLATPEKNKRIVSRVTSRRDDTTAEHSMGTEFSECESQCSDNSEESGMMQLFKTAMRFNEPQDSEDVHSSFLSFSGVDVSRISASDQFPDDSFQATNCNSDIRDFLPPIDRTPSRQFRESSHAQKKRYSPRRPFSSPRQPLSQSFSSPAHGTSACHPRADIPLSFEKENTPNFALALSPIAARAGSTAKKLLRKLSPIISESDPFPPTPTRSIHHGETLHNSPTASPISRTNSHTNLSAIIGAQNGYDQEISLILDSSILEHKVTLNSSCDTLSTTCDKENTISGSKVVFKANSSGYSGSGTQLKKTTRSSAENHNYRRQYRSVVPTRVFMSDEDQFLGRDDSFSTPSFAGTSSSTSIVELEEHKKSLLVSFEEAFLDGAIGECD